jgi:hypothetical protein
MDDSSLFGCVVRRRKSLDLDQAEPAQRAGCATKTIDRYPRARQVCSPNYRQRRAERTYLGEAYMEKADDLRCELRDDLRGQSDHLLERQPPPSGPGCIKRGLA